MGRVLVLTTEPLPLPGKKTTGAGLRAWSLGFGLRSAGFRDVTIAFAADAVRGEEPDLGAVPNIRLFERAALDDFIAGENPDVVVFQHWGLLRDVLRPLPCPMAIDLAGPHLLERRLWNSPRPAEDRAEKIAALSRADFVTCSGHHQRHYFLPFLLEAGFPPDGALCPVIPFSVSPDLPEPSAERDHTTFVYTGYFLPWQDPSLALESVVEALEAKGRGRLLLVGGAHPGGDVSQGRFERLLERLDASPHVERRGPLPFDQLVGLLRQTGPAIDHMACNTERELAFPSRTMIYLWAGVPVLHHDYDEVAPAIARARAGWTFPENDTAGITRTVNRLLAHREDAERRGANAQELVRNAYTWDRTIEPLATWCADPHPRADKRPVAITVTEPNRPAPLGKIAYAPARPVTDPAAGAWYLSPVVFLLALPISAVLVFLFGLAEIARLLVSPKR